MKTRSLVEVKNPLNSLPEIVQEYNAIKLALVQTMGELTPEMEESLKITDVALRAKADAYHYVDESLEADAAFFKRKAAAFADLAKRFSKAQDKLRENIKAAMTAMECAEIKGNDYRWCLERGAPKLVIDEAKLPAELQIVVTTTVPDKDRIKELLKGGFEVPGASLEEVARLVPRETVKE